jgi:hypothetical protein
VSPPAMARTRRIASRSATIRPNGCRYFTRSGGKPDDNSA